MRKLYLALVGLLDLKNKGEKNARSMHHVTVAMKPSGRGVHMPLLQKISRGFHKFLLRRVVWLE